MPVQVAPINERMDLVFLRMKTGLMLLDPKNYIWISMDIPNAVSVAVGSLPKVRPLFPELFELKGFDRKAAEEFEDRIKVLQYLHGKCVSPAIESNEVNPLHTEATKLREILGSQAKTIVARGHMDPKEFANVVDAKGFKNNALDLQVVATKLNDNFESINAKSQADEVVFPLSKKEIQRGLELSYQIIETVSRAEQSPEVTAENNDLRQRAYTLFMQSYKEIRSGLQFIRRNIGDADEILPSLYGSHKPKSKTTDNDSVDPVPSPVDSSPEPVTEPRAVPLGARGGSPFRD